MSILYGHFRQSSPIRLALLPNATSGECLQAVAEMLFLQIAGLFQQAISG